ncbi:hypothetical protein GCM10007940_09180 [Portibacter lacus]|uniref:Outer membrane protein beta-barrel domain-containing protein n=2 Tax=Portibacter lacus TaxID=1099794 RepID=A0AA37WD02_9BACT|nr:hypothetical protein GCM10007940_09180 [Portibacter lacus]
MHGQIGLQFRYSSLNVEEWTDATKEADLFKNNFDFGIDYWLRLKEYRVEFNPELYTSRASTEGNSANYKSEVYGLSTNTNFYIFDFIGDCNCPTFSKDGNFFTKGFFISATPMVEYHTKKAESVDDGPELKVNNTYFAGAIGAGVDIGLTDLITITPYIRYKLTPNVSWDGLSQFEGMENVEDEKFLLKQLQFGVRLGFRPDYIREQNKYRFR